MIELKKQPHKAFRKRELLMFLYKIREGGGVKCDDPSSLKSKVIPATAGGGSNPMVTVPVQRRIGNCDYPCQCGRGLKHPLPVRRGRLETVLSLPLKEGLKTVVVSTSEIEE
jgi:hypothetical protein